jgi:regulator of cell morphogenesis and NO signaling
MDIGPSVPVGALAARFPFLVRILEDASIDYHLSGARSLREACEKARASFDHLLERIDGEVLRPREVVVDWSTAPLGSLVSHVVDGHHAFSRQLAQEIRESLIGAQRAHPDWRFLVRLEVAFDDFATHLEEHFRQEESVAFRYVDALARGVVPHTEFESVDGPTGILEFEHESVEDSLARLRSLSDGYMPPPGACAALRSGMAGLSALERDLHEHLHLENNVLFPRARELEQRLLGPARG